jgi:plasmid replication initiation protein
MATLKSHYLVEKRNVLNEIRSNNMTLQELRFFCIYLSRINQRDIYTRVVRFFLDDFQTIMELSSNIKIPYMKSVTNSLLSKIVNVPNHQTGGYKGFQLFKECEVDTDENGNWYIQIDAHDLALPLLFDFKNKYFTYQLWNALRLKSSNQLRMYEILKQYQTVGYRILKIDELRSLLGTTKNEYPRYNDFKKWVLDACQQALLEYTDIKFTYEPHEKRGKGSKVVSIKFTIMKNDDYTDQLTLSEFIKENKLETSAADGINDENEDASSPYSDRINFLIGACNEEFTYNQVVTLHDKMRALLPTEELKNQTHCYHYLNNRYNEMIRHAEKGGIRNRFGYVKSLIGKEI